MRPKMPLIRDRTVPRVPVSGRLLNSYELRLMVRELVERQACS